MSTAGASLGTHDSWVPLSVDSVRQLLEQVKGPRTIPDDVLERVASGFRIPEPDRFQFSTQMRTVGKTRVLKMALSALRVSGAVLGTSGVVHVGFVLEGAITLTPRGGETVRFGPGRACVVTDWNDFDVASADGTTCLHILVPEARLRDRGVRVPANRFRIDASRSLKIPLRALASSVTEPTWSPSRIGESVAERAIEDLMVGMFLEAEGFAIDSDDLRASLRARAATEIAARHRHADLNPAAVAEHLGVSLRHLQRAFADSGASVVGEIIRNRVESAALLLAAPGASGLTIAEIAKRAGFASPFELRTAFRTRYGMLPSEYRDATESSVARQDMRSFASAP